jgi:hypothetical protein
MEEKQPQLDISDVDDILLGEDPTENWTPEERAKVEDLMATLVPKPKPKPINLSEHFKAGEIIRDPDGLRIAIRSVGSSCMNVGLIGGKKGSFVNNYQMSIGPFVFVTMMSKKKDTVLRLIGIEQPQPAAEGGNDAEA